MSDTLIKVKNVSKKFCRNHKKSLWYGLQDLCLEITGHSSGEIKNLRPDEFWAVRHVNFELKRGQCLGLIGRNGAGKTTLLRMLNGLIKPDTGYIEMRGKIGALIALGAGFNPILTGRENIYVNGTVLGLSKSELDDKIEEIIDFAELAEFIDMPVQSYSSGMAVRLGFSIASTLNPDILILDEVLAVGDAAFRNKCWYRIGKLLQNAAVILVSHESYAISRICDQSILLEQGEIKKHGPSGEVLSLYASTLPSTFHTKECSTHESVNYVKLQTINSKLCSGDTLIFDFEIEMKKTMPADHAVINIMDSSDDIHAQCLVVFPNNSIAIGLNKYRISIGPLFLSKGNFSLVTLISTHGGKQPLVHSRHEIRFTFEGHVNYGPKYYPPGYVETLPIGDQQII